MLWPLRLALKVLAVVVAVLLVYFAVTLVQVWLTSRQYAPRRAQAIVVMGSAQYDGVPSPDLKARLDEALLLYQKGYAPLIAVTGSKEKGDQFTEAGSSATYLEDHGVKASAIVEAKHGGDDSWQNLADVAPDLRAKGVHTVLVVTDPFHEDRSMAIASDVGLEPYPTPTRTSPITGWSTVPYFMKEALGVAVGRVIGFQNLHSLG